MIVVPIGIVHIKVISETSATTPSLIPRNPATSAAMIAVTTAARPLRKMQIPRRLMFIADLPPPRAAPSGLARAVLLIERYLQSHKLTVPFDWADGIEAVAVPSRWDKAMLSSQICLRCSAKAIVLSLLVNAES